MAILEHHNTSIKSQITPKVDTTIDNLNQVIRHNNTISVPSSFLYRSLTLEYLNDIVSIKNIYSNQKEYLATANKMLDNSIEQMNNDLLEIKKVEVKPRGEAL